VQNQVAMRGGYVRPMAPAEVTDFVRAQQQMWNPVLQKLALDPK